MTSILEEMMSVTKMGNAERGPDWSMEREGQEFSVALSSSKLFVWESEVL